MSDDPWEISNITPENKDEIDKAWREHYIELERTKPIPGAKLTRSQAQVLGEDAVVLIRSKKYPALVTTGSVMVLREAGAWELDEIEVFNVKFLPIACLEAESTQKE